jgi:hypothetical protein
MLLFVCFMSLCYILIRFLFWFENVKVVLFLRDCAVFCLVSGRGFAVKLKKNLICSYFC